MEIKQGGVKPPLLAAIAGAAVVALFLTGVARADWPQWGGPHRDFTSASTGLAAKWPEGGPKKLWSRDLGEGYSAISTENGRLYTMYRRGGQDVAVALDAATGKTIWEHAYDAPFQPGTDLTYGVGPHSAPLVDGPLVFTVGATGILHALDKSTGKPVWRHHVLSEFGGYVRPTGYNCSPLAYKDTIILLVGGPGAGVMAFHKKTGAVAWRKHDFKTSSSSPILITVDGQEQLVAFMFEEIIGMDPASGELLWRHPHKTEYGLNVSTPVWGADNLLFMSSAYDSGSRVIRLKRNGAKTEVEELWASRLMRLHFGNAIRIGDVVFGSSGDFGPAPLTAVDIKTGQVLWRNRALARASFVLADGRLIALDEDGTLALLNVTPQGPTVLARAPLLERIAWTVPTLDGSTLYVRDRKRILALDLK